MRFITAASAAALLAGCATVPADRTAPAAPSLNPLPASVTSELPRNARPAHYAIEVVPDADKLTFSGRVAIDLALFEASRTITVNSVGLSISEASIAPVGGGAAVPLQVAYDKDKETATFTAAEALAAGNYRLEIAYSGPIGRKPSGFFALDYPDKRTGEPKRALGTQFEIPDAREFAPMFDEPSYKATFDLSAVVPADQMAVSNMPVASETDLDNGTKRVVFATTPKMSSYLLFFGVGDFERLAKTVDGTSVGIVSPTGSGETARYALDEAVEVLPYYNDYFGVKYPLPKLDNIGMPGSSQQFGAMENWGAIFTFEDNLLVDPRTTSPDKLRYIHTALAHEMAHQWFGDLVTMAWWDDLWLNEGFASWMESKATAKFRPDWNTEVGKVNSREGAMAADALRTTHPIVLTSKTAKEADEQFDSIAYSKGETILTMFEDYAGADTWREGIRGYMKAPRLRQHDHRRPVAGGREGRREGAGRYRSRLHQPGRRPAGHRVGDLCGRAHEPVAQAGPVQPRPAGRSRRQPQALAGADDGDRRRRLEASAGARRHGLARLARLRRGQRQRRPAELLPHALSARHADGS